MSASFDDSALQEIITGRVEPHIYSFQTNTLPNLLKVGDTYRPVEERLNEWRRYYKDLEEVSRHKAMVNDDTFFRDHSIHKFLRQDGVTQIPIDPVNQIYSKEFFKDISALEVGNAVDDVINSYGTPGKYEYYNNLKEKVELHYTRSAEFSPRDNQQEVITNFSNALNGGRTNLLMYAVMRFGKSITSMWCAHEMNSKLTIVVSGKADVRSEWKQTVESHKDFFGYRFMDASDLKKGLNLADVYGAEFQTGSGETETCTNIVLFLTLQDLAGSSETIKEHHRILQEANPDLLIIDETHFGARAQVLGKILAGVELIEEDEEALKITDTVDELGRIDKLEAINAKVKLHLSGTPYRILMGSEFEEEDIIAFVQFSDIYEDKLQWSADNLDEDEWKNPYYGFPQMIRFAFNPNESSRKKLAQIPGSKPSELFLPANIGKSGAYESFVHEQEVIDLLQVLDGSKDDNQLLGLLDHESIKAGKLANHIVIVLPYRASCDAFERLVSTKKDLFKNLSEYTIFNISGHNRSLKEPEDIKSAISKAHSEKKKTITLTVNKMLTGTTVPEWDTMLYLKGTSSPQEYDQAIFRLQSPWVEKYVDEQTSDVIKYDMKPQTLLVDLDPTRLFHLQEIKAFTYGANTHEIGNEKIEEFIGRELKVSPIIALNAEGNKLVEINASKIIDAVRKYSNERSITDDVNEISVDLSLRDNADIYDVVSKLSELGGRGGLDITPTEDEGDELEGEPVEPTPTEEPGAPAGGSEPAQDNDDDNKSFEKQFRMYYVLILLFAFLSTTEEKTLNDVIDNIDASEDNRRIANSLGLRKEHLVTLRDNMSWSVRSSLEYKIQNSDFRANDKSISPVEHVEIAINKFGKISDSEIFTPASIVNEIFDNFNSDFWGEVTSTKVLDIASKSGSFARGFIVKAEEHGLATNKIKDNFYSIPTSPAAYEFTRKMYEAIGLNIDNIAQHFTSYDILDLKTSSVVAKILSHKKLSQITKADLELISGKIDTNESKEDQVKFAAIVGNPPYDSRTGTNFSKSIYNEFFDAATELNPDYVSMIHPAKFLFNSGATPKAWNQKMLNDPHLSIKMYEPDMSKVFADVGAKGGVCITFWDRNQNDGGLNGVFTAHDELKSILEKTKDSTGISEIISTAGGSPTVRYEDRLGRKRSYFRTSAFFHLANVFSESKDARHNIKIYGLLKGNKRSQRYVSEKMLNDPTIDSWKVFLPESNGSGAIGESLSNPFVGEPGTGCTESFIRIGSFESELEAINCMKYIKSKFCRALLATIKVTQHNPKSTWKNVPIQNFSNISDIDWSESIAEIDKQLYAKYSLDKNEIAFVEEQIKAME